MKILCTSDWHLRHDCPECRNEKEHPAFWNVQMDKIRFIFQTSRKKGNIPIFHAGDVFHKPCVAKEFENEIIKEAMKYNRTIYSIPGNHDLPGGNLGMVNKTSYQTLVNSDILSPHQSLDINVFMSHKYIYHKEQPSWGDDKNTSSAKKFMKEYSQYPVIITGDNHESFVVRSDDKKQILINPGCICRQRLSEQDYVPKIYIVDTKDLSCEEVEIPCEPKEKVISSEHLKTEVEIDQRIVDFISKLNDRSIEIDFEESLKSALTSNKISKEVKKIILDSME